MGFSAPFIKISEPFDSALYAAAPAPLFRRKFTLSDVGRVTLQICAVGYGYCYINGQAVTEDLLCAPVSEYNRMLWYNEYDVSHLMQKGDNVIAVILGNGFFNENFPSSWENHKAAWRNHPRFALALLNDDETVLQSDEQFVWSNRSFVTYNQLRSGETFDARLYDPRWKEWDFDDSDFTAAVIDTALEGVPRELCSCEPIREFEEYDFVSAKQTDEGWLLDFGVNMSGYLRVNVREAAGTEIVMRHAEEAYPDGRLKLNNLDLFYPTVDFQTDRYICGEEPITWSPKFTYHGFRFVLVSGLTAPPQKGDFKSVYVHQAVERKSDFRCSEPLLNTMYEAAIRSTYSNMFYALTDCPTREKFGWTNDAQASTEQVYINFTCDKFFEKWTTDMRYCLREDGRIPAIIPSHDWGFDWGPVADGILMDLPYKDYLYTGNPRMMITMLPSMEQYYRFFKEKSFDDAETWLSDWDGHVNRYPDKNLIRLLYTIRFCRTMLLAQKLAGVPANEQYEADKRQAEQELTAYVDEHGRSVTDSQTAISLLLSLDVLPAEPLIAQLKERVAADDFHVTSGTIGLVHVFDELSRHGAADYAYRLLTAKGHPSYSYWFEECDATSFWETWESGHTDSRNHHMLSCVVTYFHKWLLGIAPTIDHPGFEQIDLHPYFPESLQSCEGHVGTPYGDVRVTWTRQADGVRYEVTIPEGITATFRGEALQTGRNLLLLVGE